VLAGAKTNSSDIGQTIFTSRVFKS